MKEFITEFSSWTAAGATGLSLWFIIRFVNRHDKFKDQVKVDITDATKSFSIALKTMERIVDDVGKNSILIKQDNLSFQSKIISETNEVRKEIFYINSLIGKTSQKADEISKKFEITFSHLDRLQSMIDTHHKSLQLGAKALLQGRDEMSGIKTKLDQHTEDFKTVKKNISDTLILIKKKS